MKTSKNGTLVLEMALRGPENNGGICPYQSYVWQDPVSNYQYCYCGSNCCWDKCNWSSPSESCLSGIPNAKWKFIQGIYSAFIPGECFEDLKVILNFKQQFSKRLERIES